MFVCVYLYVCRSGLGWCYVSNVRFPQRTFSKWSIGLYFAEKLNCWLKTLRSHQYVMYMSVVWLAFISYVTGSAVTLNVDNKSSRRTVYDSVVHDPLHFSVDTISVGGTSAPLVIRSQTAKSTFTLHTFSNETSSHETETKTSRDRDWRLWDLDQDQKSGLETRLVSRLELGKIDSNRFARPNRFESIRSGESNG